MTEFLTARGRTLPILVVAVLIALASTLVVVLASPSSGTGGGASMSATPGPVVGGKAKTVRVDISMFKYGPARVTIAPGTTLVWTNKDSTEHTATADSGPAFDTGAIQQGQMRSVTFTKAGTYAYHCAFHAFMTATVVVR